MDQNESGNNVRELPRARVVDFKKVREQKLEEKRRKNERVFFKTLLGVYTAVGDGRKLKSIEINDISEDGLSFQLPHNAETPWPSNMPETLNTPFPMRLYFSQDTYLEILCKIQNTTPTIMNNTRYVRYGCAVDTTTKSYEAYSQFVKFLKIYSENAHKDMGDVSVFYL